MRNIALALISLALIASLQADESPWPCDAPGFDAPEGGEHPRLFFRRSDLPELKRRAASTDGKAIVARLKELVSGDEMPTIYNPNRGRQRDGSGGLAADSPEGKTYTLWHGAGFGMLWQLTGEKKYADLAKECVAKALEGQRDRDNRYSFRNPVGALRAGPSLGAIAMAYDLGYDGWDEEFRLKVAKALEQYNEGANMSLAELARGSRHNPGSNHWGCQIGGAALALLAIRNDPGIDDKKLQPLIEQNAKAIIRQLTEGFGDGGMFWEGKGPGGIASDTAFVPALQAWRVAGGKDFISPRPHATAISLIKCHELLLIDREPWYPIPKPSGYGSGYFGPEKKGSLPCDRDGLSRGGQFAQGFGAIPDKYKPALLWTYNHIVEPDPKQRTYDTVSPYPHRAMLALVNWPIDIKEVNPADLLPKVHVDKRLKHYSFRNQWTGTEEDIVVNATFGARDPHGLMVWGNGERRTFSNCPRGDETHFYAGEDGSGSITVGGMALGVDFSKKSGASALVIATGRGASGKQTVKAGDTTFYVTLIGGQPEIKPDGGKLKIGEQTVKLENGNIVFGAIAKEQKLPRIGTLAYGISRPQTQVVETGEPITKGTESMIVANNWLARWPTGYRDWHLPRSASPEFAPRSHRLSCDNTSSTTGAGNHCDRDSL